MSDVSEAYQEAQKVIDEAQAAYNKVLQGFRSVIKNDLSSISASADKVQAEVGKMHRRAFTIFRTGTENAATNVAETSFAVVPRKAQVKAIYLQSKASVSNSNTDHNKLYVYKRTSAGATAVLLGSWNTATAAQSAVTAFAANSLSLSSTSTDLAIDAGAVLTYHVGKFNAGQAMGEFSVTVDVEEV